MVEKMLGEKRKYMTIDLHTQADAVTDESTFINFLEALAADREDEISREAVGSSSPYRAGSSEWENGTIEAFLGAASAWAIGSTNGLPYYEVPINPWKRCAQILLMGKLYE